ncbi:hypothetical protein [Streptomyces sp. B6B3]|uniref:hypothetical protein n=1 Tax=Streptomyces sp. B6B3 TaxID=3153570 RepID=UPI00325D4BD2
MAAEKLSISFDPETVARARRAAGRAGLPLSTWIDRAARHEADLDEARAALAEQYETFGEPGGDEREWANQALTDAGVGQPEPAEELAARRYALAALDETASEGGG